MYERFLELVKIVTPVLKPYVRRVSVFGSYARFEETRDSDIDLLIELRPQEQRPKMGLFVVIRLENELKNRLGRKIDLITENGISPRIKGSIEKDRVVLYEEN